MYTPKLREDLIRRLYRLKQLERRPMTVLANEAVEEYLTRKLPTTKEADNERRELYRRITG